jgi:hypothetical protein
MRGQNSKLAFTLKPCTQLRLFFFEPLDARDQRAGR